METRERDCRYRRLTFRANSFIRHRQETTEATAGGRGGGGGGTAPTLSTHQATMTRTRKTTSKIDKRAMMITVLLLRDSGVPWNVWATQARKKKVISPPPQKDHLGSFQTSYPVCTGDM